MPPKLSKRFFHLGFSFVIGAMMVFIMTGVVTLVNIGLEADFLWRWLQAFAIAYPIAVPAIYFLSPTARRLTERFVESPFS